MGKAIMVDDLVLQVNIGKVTITGGGTPPPEPIAVTNVNITTKPSLIENNAQLAITYTPSNTTQKGATWKSSNENIATVNSAGYVTVKTAGSVTITATSMVNPLLSDSFIATCTVTQVYVPVTSINLNGGDGGKVSETLQLTATVLPNNATNKGVIWKSSNDSIATVDSNGLVSLKAEGGVAITATSSSETMISNSKQIVVTEAPPIGSGSAAEIYNSYITESGRGSTPQLLNMLSELKDIGILDKLEGLYYLAGTSISQAKINIINPTGYSLLNGHSLYTYMVDADGMKSTGTYAGVQICQDFKMSLKRNFSFGVLTTTEPEAGSCVGGFQYGNTNEGLYIFPAKYNGSGIVLFGPMTLVSESNLSKVDVKGCYMVSYNATSGDGNYVTDTADAKFNRKSGNIVDESELRQLGILAGNGGGAIPSKWGTRASIKFAYVTSVQELSLTEMKLMRDILKTYSNLL